MALGAPLVECGSWNDCGFGMALGAKPLGPPCRVGRVAGVDGPWGRPVGQARGANSSWGEPLFGPPYRVGRHWTLEMALGAPLVE